MKKIIMNFIFGGCILLFSLLGLYYSGHQSQQLFFIIFFHSLSIIIIIYLFELRIGFYPVTVVLQSNITQIHKITENECNEKNERK
jgi:hypothetical protein